MKRVLVFKGELTEGKHFDLFVREGEKTTYVANEVLRALMPYKLKNVDVVVTIDVEEELTLEDAL